jgi:hypothetical protein
VQSTISSGKLLLQSDNWLAFDLAAVVLPCRPNFALCMCLNAHDVVAQHLADAHGCNVLSIMQLQVHDNAVECLHRGSGKIWLPATSSAATGTQHVAKSRKTAAQSTASSSSNSNNSSKAYGRAGTSSITAETSCNWCRSSSSSSAYHVAFTPDGLHILTGKNHYT